MKPKTIFLSISLSISILLSACGSAQSASSTPTEMPGPTATATLVPSATPSPTITPTATPAIPMLSVSRESNCYGGPSDSSYDKVTVLTAGEQAEVLGQDSKKEYWIVANPHGEGGCWIQSHLVADVTGEVSALPVLIAPPTPIPPVPDTPGNIAATHICKERWEMSRVRVHAWWVYRSTFDHFDVTITLTWEDVVGETGYRILRNGNLVAELDADTTVYSDSFSSYAEREVFQYAIQSLGEGDDSPLASFVTGHSCVKAKK